MRARGVESRLALLARVPSRPGATNGVGGAREAESPARAAPEEDGGGMAKEVILQTEGLSKEFRGFYAVKDVALQVRRGAIHALIGPNGAGKTTCFNLLTKFLTPTRGRIVYEGRDITAAKPADVAKMGLVRSFQISAVFGHLTALENVRVALQRGRGESFDFWRSERVLERYDGRALELLDAVGVAGFAHVPAVELPYG